MKRGRPLTVASREVLDQFKLLDPKSRYAFLASLIGEISLPEALTMSRRIEPRLRRDFLRELPTELALHCLSFVSISLLSLLFPSSHLPHTDPMSRTKHHEESQSLTPRWETHVRSSERVKYPNTGQVSYKMKTRGKTCVPDIVSPPSDLHSLILEHPTSLNLYPSKRRESTGSARLI